MHAHLLTVQPYARPAVLLPKKGYAAPRSAPQVPCAPRGFEVCHAGPRRCATQGCLNMCGVLFFNREDYHTIACAITHMIAGLLCGAPPAERLRRRALRPAGALRLGIQPRVGRPEYFYAVTSARRRYPSSRLRSPRVCPAGIHTVPKTQHTTPKSHAGILRPQYPWDSLSTAAAAVERPRSCATQGYRIYLRDSQTTLVRGTSLKRKRHPPRTSIGP